MEVKKKKRRSDRKIMTKEGQTLKYLRESRHLSMRKASRIVGVSEAQVNHAENGRMDLDPTLILKFVEAYGYSYDKFQSMLDGKLEVPEHNLSECIEILKRLAPEKLRTVKIILQSF